MRIPCFFHAMDVLTWLVVMASLGFMGHAAQGQGALGVLDMDVLVPPGGVLSNGAPANLSVAPGDLLLSPIQSPTSMFHVLVDDEANMTWAEQTPFRGFFMKPWGPGEFVWYNYALRKWTVVDPNFTTLDTLTQTFVADDDYHDVHRFDDGSYLVVLLEELYMDLTELGGLDNAKVLNPRMLHLDQNETVLREWSGLEHLPIDPALDNLLFSTVDHLHWNAVQFDAHGGLLMSFRNRDQIVRLRPDDWSIHWKLGGPDTDFELTDPGWEGFHVQHDVHDLGNNRILLFDNGIFNANGYLSRALELELDTVNFTATNVWQFAHPSGVYAPAQGSAIRLANGNTLIGWGTAETGEFGTRVTEVTPDGQIAFEVRMADGSTMYRARKYPPGTLSGCQEEGAVNPSPSPWVLGPAPCLFDVDADGDGWTDVEGDCNDDDATAYPGAFETLDDGVDQDCDGMDAVAGCTDVSATNFSPWANVPDGSCLHALSLTVDFALEWVTLGSPNWDLSMAAVQVSIDGFASHSTLGASAVAFHAAQFELDVPVGALSHRFVRPDGVVEGIVRGVEVLEGTGSLALDVACFNELVPCLGCSQPGSTNFNPLAMPGGTCLGEILVGCTYQEASNYDPLASMDDGSCVFDSPTPCMADLDDDGVVASSDLLLMLVGLGSACP